MRGGFGVLGESLGGALEEPSVGSCRRRGGVSNIEGGATNSGIVRASYCDLRKIEKPLMKGQPDIDN